MSKVQESFVATPTIIEGDKSSNDLLSLRSWINHMLEYHDMLNVEHQGIGFVFTDRVDDVLSIVAPADRDRVIVSSPKNTSNITQHVFKALSKSGQSQPIFIAFDHDKYEKVLERVQLNYRMAHKAIVVNVNQSVPADKFPSSPLKLVTSKYEPTSILFEKDDFVVAEGFWEGNRALACRWHPLNALGYPNGFGRPQWFILPDVLWSKSGCTEHDGGEFVLKFLDGIVKPGV